MRSTLFFTFLCLSFFYSTSILAQSSIKDLPILSVKNIRIGDVFLQGNIITNKKLVSDNQMVVTTEDDVVTFTVIPNNVRLFNLGGNSAEVCLMSVSIQSKNNTVPIQPDIFFSFELTDGIQSVSGLGSLNNGTIFRLPNNEPFSVQYSQGFFYSVAFKQDTKQVFGYTGTLPVMATITTGNLPLRTLRSLRKKTEGRR